MSLERYRRPRLIVLHPRSTAYEAARAMADNHIGAVLVGEDRALVGIVTDRDLALDVVAADLDPRATTLRDVMSDEVVAVDMDATVDDVARIMRDRGVRRVPVVENGRPVGIVTLDDLVIARAISTDTARDIITAQLEVAARYKPEGQIAPAPIPRAGADRRTRARMRRMSRAENTYGRLIRAVERQTGLDTRERAERALVVVLGNICRRLTADEARHFIAQLPSKLHPELERNLDGPVKNITPATIENELREALDLVPEVASDLLYAICETVSDCVSAGEIESVRGQLPATMKDLFPPMPYRKAG
jgi:CBS domain-containing protein/uncharacterized protein (DUF2267 family)